MRTMVLSDLGVGQRGIIAAIALDAESKQRLLELGLTKGSRFEVVRFAPLGDPVDIRIRGYHLSLRKAEAAGIEVEPA